MEVHLEATQREALPADTFVSLRVGDVQKQSRLSADSRTGVVARTFRFPDPGDFRSTFGRIEVYKRIGAMTVNFDEPNEAGVQEVEVPCSLHGFPALSFGLRVKGGQAQQATTLEATEKHSRSKKRLDLAQQYLSEHRLEDVIADAMREVIHERPDDPLARLSEFLLQQRTVDATLKPPGPPASPERQSAPPPAEPSAMKSAPPPALPPKQSAEPAVQPSSAKSAPPLVPPLEPPEPELVVEQRPAKAEAQVLAAEFGHCASVGTWLSHRPLRPAELTEHATPVAPTCRTDGDEARPPPAPGSFRTAPWTMLPSVGTWSTALTEHEELTEHAAPVAPTCRTDGDEARPPPASSSFRTSPWTMLPSVGTWNTALIEHEDAPPLPRYAFARMPSVGTWLAPMARSEEVPRRPDAACAPQASSACDAPSFAHQASVASWLQGIPHQVPRPWFYQKASMKEMAPEQAEEIVDKLQDLVSEKDKEIEQLKAMILEMNSAKA